MARAGDSKLREPLLRPAAAACRDQPLRPLLAVAFLNTAARVVAHTPAFCLRFQDLALASGLEVAQVAAAVGGLTALRSLVELASTPMLARWSDRAGRRRVLLLCCAAYCLEYGVLCLTANWLCFSAAYIAGGVLASHNAIEGSCIVDATASSESRSSAFSRLFMALGLAFVAGPALGGELVTWDWAAPFAAAAAMAGCSLLLVAFRMPEYLPEPRRRDEPGMGILSTLGSFGRLILQDPCLGWYVCASALSTLGISSFISVRTLWAHEVFGWDGREIGRVVSTYGCTLVFAQFVLLPLLLQAMQGREALLAQLCLLVHAGRFTAYGLAPGGVQIYLALVVSSAGSCSVPVLQALCSRRVPEDDQGLLSGGASALSTATQALGSLVGSQLFAASLRGGAGASSHLLVCAAFCGLAAACMVPGMCAEARAGRRRPHASWVSRAEGMHGMDATLPSPTARGSMLLRRAWLRISDRAGA